MVGYSVKLAAQHLSKGRFIPLAGFRVTSPITFPFTSAVFATKLGSVENSGTLLDDKKVELSNDVRQTRSPT